MQSCSDRSYLARAGLEVEEVEVVEQFYNDMLRSAPLPPGCSSLSTIYYLLPWPNECGLSRVCNCVTSVPPAICNHY